MRFSVLLPVAALAAVVAAAPSALEARDGGDCNTGPIQCCNSVGKASDSGISAIIGLLGLVLGDITGLVGVHCSPIVGSTKCSQQPICCKDNNYSGLIVIGCSPVNIL